MVDYRVYLVTDSTMVPESTNFLSQVQRSVEAGATLVQLREKSLSTSEFIERAKAVQKITKSHGIPLIINDRIDVALAIDADGVHVGQDDMPAKTARYLLGPHKILGVTCSNPEEVDQVCQEKVADYVGIGTVYQTNTKKDTKTPFGTGPIGIRKMLSVLKQHNQTAKSPLKCVAIGGINHSNCAKVMYQCQVENQGLDGVAIVSCIMANEDAYKATKDLHHELSKSVPWSRDILSEKPVQQQQFKSLEDTGPLVHHITNNVVKNFSANVTLAIGASPIMSELAEEYEEFASKISNISLVLNVGTPTSEMMKVFIHAIQTYNKYGKHIVYDPVAVGATSTRLECSRILLNAGQMSVIKGNVGEIHAIWKLSSQYKPSESSQSLMRGVDSIASLSDEDIITMASDVSRDFKCVVVVSGAVNYVIDTHFSSSNIVTVKGGHKLMGSITGSGCSLGSTIGSYLAAKSTGSPFNIYEAIVTAVQLYNKAGAMAGDLSDAPGSFVPTFLDCLYKITHS